MESIKMTESKCYFEDEFHPISYFKEIQEMILNIKMGKISSRNVLAAQ